jgi:hypothetical protein
MILPDEEAFPLPKDPPTWQDKQRECLGLFKWEPLETRDEFAERVFRESKLKLESLQKTHPPKPSKKLSAWDNAKLRILGITRKLLRKATQS